MDYCGNCGAKIIGNDNFCRSCGSSLTYDQSQKKESPKKELITEPILDKLGDEFNFNEKPKKNNSQFKKWLFRDEKKSTNKLYILFGFIALPLITYLNMVLINYINLLPLGKVKFGELPFEENIVFYFTWLLFGVPLILMISYLLSLIKWLRLKTAKIFFLISFLLVLVFGGISVKLIIPVLKLNKKEVELTQEKIKAKIESQKPKAKKEEEPSMGFVEYSDRGFKRLNDSNYEGALEDFNKLVDFFSPENPHFRHYRGKAKQGLNDWEGAIVDFNKAIELKEVTNKVLYDSLKTKAAKNTPKKIFLFSIKGELKGGDIIAEMIKEKSDELYDYIEISKNKVQSSYSIIDLFVSPLSNDEIGFLRNEIDNYKNLLIVNFGSKYPEYIDKIERIDDDLNLHYLRYDFNKKTWLSELTESQYNIRKIEWDILSFIIPTYTPKEEKPKKKKYSMSALQYYERGKEKFQRYKQDYFANDSNYEFALASVDVVDGAIADLTKAIKMKPNYTDAYRYRAEVKIKKGMIILQEDKNLKNKVLNSAIADLSKAIKIKPEIGSHYSLSNLYFERGFLKTLGFSDFNGALEDYTKGIEIDPYSREAGYIYLNRASTKLSLGDKSGACADWRIGLSITGDDYYREDFERLCN